MRRDIAMYLAIWDKPGTRAETLIDGLDFV